MCRARRTHFFTFIVLLIAARSAPAQVPATGTNPLARGCAITATAGSGAEHLLGAALVLNGAGAPLVSPMADTEVALGRSLLHEALGLTGDRCTKTVLSASSWYNSSAANSEADGIAWQGRGITVLATVGAEYSRGILRFRVQPVAFAAENRDFRPAFAGPNSIGFRHSFWPDAIDLPYRHGAGFLARLGPGESEVALVTGTLGIGISSKTQRWGPARFYPLLIGPSGPGIPRLYAQLRPVHTALGTVTAQWQLGWLEASNQSPVALGSRSRVAPAVVGFFTPRGLDALTLGASRFFHVRREGRSMGWGSAVLPFSGILKKRSADSEVGGYNQLATAMLRLALPGLNVYGEFLRDDHNVDLADLIAEPDHASAWMAGLQVVRNRGGGLNILTIERAIGRITHLQRIRQQSPVYTHVAIPEGHTHLGQPIGSEEVLGGGGFTLSFERTVSRQSRQIMLEIRNEGQTEEGGTVGEGRSVGSAGLLFGQRISTSRGLLGVELQMRKLYGLVGGINATIAASWSG